MKKYSKKIDNKIITYLYKAHVTHQEDMVTESHILNSIILNYIPCEENPQLS
jgi:hypothetical protein